MYSVYTINTPYQWTDNFIVRQCFSMIGPAHCLDSGRGRKHGGADGGNIICLTSRMFFQKEMWFGDQSDSLGSHVSLHSHVV